MNDKYIHAISNLRFSSDFEDRTIKLIKEKEEKRKQKNLNKYAMVFALIAIMVTSILVYQYTNTSKEKIDEQNIFLEKSDDSIRAFYTEKFPKEKVIVEADLAMLTENEIFNGYNTSIFLGKVVSIKNIAVEFGDKLNYWSIVMIEVEENYRGEEKIGELVKVRLDFPFSEDFFVEDTDTLSNIEVGSRGIFMPIKYDEANELYIENGKKLYLSDIADYGFMDSERFAFIDGKEGLIFADWSYKNINVNSSLDDVKEYIKVNYID